MSAPVADLDPTAAAFVFLKPGEWVLAEEPTRVKTILGSCVAITVRAPRFHLAAMTHCLLPTASEATEMPDESSTLRYVDSAIETVLDVFARRGALPADLEVKLVGGADGLSLDLSRTGYSVGARNVRVAMREMARRGITPAASVVGGRSGRVLIFDTGTGELFVKNLVGSIDKQLARNRG